MPLYDFRCKQCGLDFEVSRPISRATDPAMCPIDNTEAERIFTMPMTFVKSDPRSMPPPQPPGVGGGWSHFGHSHGVSATGHEHGGYGAPTPESPSGA